MKTLKSNFKCKYKIYMVNFFDASPTLGYTTSTSTTPMPSTTSSPSQSLPTAPQARLKRFIRQPDRLAGRQLTPKGLEVMAAIERYRFLPSSLLVRLVEGGQRNTHRHLQTLFHKGFINRFALPKYGGPGEFIYFYDSPQALSLLISEGLLPDLSEDDRKKREAIIRLNRDANYAKLHTDPDSQGKVLYIQHELMISRFHYLIELGAKRLGNIELVKWKQGTELWGKVEAPALRDGQETAGGLQTIPHRPDAFFVLRLKDRPEDGQLVSFMYEADRRTENTTRFKMKLRGHYHFVVKRQLQRLAPYNVHSIRAVLTETTTTPWAHNLLHAAKDPLVSPRPSPLFWMTTSELVTGWPKNKTPQLAPNGQPMPRYLVEPELIYDSLWASPTSDKLKSLSDLD